MPNLGRGVIKVTAVIRGSTATRSPGSNPYLTFQVSSYPQKNVRLWMDKGFSPQEVMMTNVAIITGASSGLGLSLSVLLAQKGYTVYATMRNPEKQAALQDAARQAGVTINVVQLDVQQLESIHACVAQIYQKEGRIDLSLLLVVSWGNLSTKFLDPAGKILQAKVIKDFLS